MIVVLSKWGCLLKNVSDYNDISFLFLKIIAIRFWFLASNETDRMWFQIGVERLSATGRYPACTLAHVQLNSSLRLHCKLLRLRLKHRPHPWAADRTEVYIYYFAKAIVTNVCYHAIQWYARTRKSVPWEE